MLPCWWYTDGLSLLLLVFFTALRTLKTLSLSHSLSIGISISSLTFCWWFARHHNTEMIDKVVFGEIIKLMLQTMLMRMSVERDCIEGKIDVCPPVRPPLITADTQIPTVLLDTLNLLIFQTLLEIFLVHRKLFPNNY